MNNDLVMWSVGSGVFFASLIHTWKPFYLLMLVICVFFQAREIRKEKGRGRKNASLTIIKENSHD